MRALLNVQSAYFVATGMWPLLHRRSFEAVTGRKSDFWLARTVGGLTTLLGLALARAARRSRRSDDARLLGLGSVPVYAAADAYAGRAFSRAYFADLVLQAGFAAAWLRYGRRSD